MQAASHSTVVPSVSPSLVKSNPAPMSLVERLDFEAALTRAFLIGKAHQRKLKQQTVRGMLQLAEVRS